MYRAKHQNPGWLRKIFSNLSVGNLSERLKRGAENRLGDLDGTTYKQAIRDETHIFPDVQGPTVSPRLFRRRAEVSRILSDDRVLGALKKQWAAKPQSHLIDGINGTLSVTENRLTDASSIGIDLRRVFSQSRLPTLASKGKQRKL
jgi:hypothetical protein